jgi:hypothetical protein
MALFTACAPQRRRKCAPDPLLAIGRHAPSEMRIAVVRIFSDAAAPQYLFVIE